jgi:hypothetical protein
MDINLTDRRACQSFNIANFGEGKTDHNRYDQRGGVKLQDTLLGCENLLYRNKHKIKPPKILKLRGAPSLRQANQEYHKYQRTNANYSP